MGFKRVVDAVELLALAAAAVFVVLLFALGADDEPTAAPTEAGAETEADGASLYRSNCASCHGAEGQGGIGPPLGGGEVVEQFPDVEDQIEVVAEGRGGMPEFGDVLTPAEIRAIVDYEREGLG